MDFKMNLELYKVFYKTAVLGSMTKAAEKLFIGQPAVSKSIKTLEEGLGVPLFVRSPKGLNLTSEGTAVFEHISQAMEQIKQAEEYIDSVKRQPAEAIKIDVCAMMFKLLILPNLKPFFKLYSNKLYEISPTSDSFFSLELLEQEKIACCILTKPLDSDKFGFVRLYTFHDYLMGSPEYVSSITTAGGDLKESATLISVMNGNIISNYEKLRLKNINFANRMKVTSMEHTIALAKMDHGIGFIAEELVQEELASNKLVKVDIPTPHHKRDVGFLLNKNTKIGLELQNFIDYYLELHL